MKRSIMIGLVVIVAIAIIGVAVGASLLNQNAGVTAPGAPTGLTVVVNGAHVQLNWTAPADPGSGVTGYNVYRSNTSGSYGGSPLIIASGILASYTDPFAIGTKHFIVKAYNSAGESPSSNEVTAVIAAPGAPMGLRAERTSGMGVSLNWTAPSDPGSGIAGYKMFRSETSGSYGSVPFFNGTGISTTDTLPATGTYYYVVKAYNAVGESTASNEASIALTAPGTPRGLVAELDGTSVALNWTAPSNLGYNGVPDYNVYRSNTSGSYESVPTFSVGTTTTFTDTMLAIGTYYYVVTAYNGAGESPASNEATVEVTEILTPTGALVMQKTDEGNYTITLLSVSESGVANSSTTITVTPDVGLGHVGEWKGGTNLSAGSFFTVGWMQPGTTYQIVVSYDPTGRSIATLNIVASAGRVIEVGQFINYTLEFTIHNNTGTHNGTGYLLMLVTSVNSTNVTYSLTYSRTFMGNTSIYVTEAVENLTTGFGGLDPDFPDAGFVITPNGTELLSTPWGARLCQKFDVTSSDPANGTGTYWVFEDTTIKMTMTTSRDAHGETTTQTLTYALADTNLIYITS